MNKILATIILCINHTDGATHASDFILEGAVNFIYEPIQLSQLRTLEGVKIVRTLAFTRSKYRAQIEEGLGILGMCDIEFIMSNGIIYPTTHTDLSIEKGDKQWMMCVIIQLAYGMTVKVIAKRIDMTKRMPCLHGVTILSAQQ